MTISLMPVQKKILEAWAATGLFGTSSTAETASHLLSTAIQEKLKDGNFCTTKVRDIMDT